MFPDPRLDVAVIVMLFSAASAYVGYWSAIGRLEARMRRLTRHNAHLINELDAVTTTIDELLDAATQRHPAAHRPSLSIITGGAS